jgi:proton-translocating NADH-quinone oxidoreductase chain M
MIIKLIFFILFIGLVLVFFSDKLKSIKLISITTFSLVLIISTYLLKLFDFNSYCYQYTLEIPCYSLDFLNINILLGLDGISLSFFYLSSLLTLLSFLFIWDKMPNEKFYALNLIIINILLLLVFSVLDLFLFYLFFESILIPMYFIIGVWGSRERRVRAVFLFFFFTLIGSFFMLIGLIYIYTVLGTLNLEYVMAYKFSFKEQYWLWLAFFFSFASKVPVFPLHIWLPEAHVEAPTVGSVLLAGILLKLGVYGFLRFNLALFPEASIYFSPLVYFLSIIGVIYASLTAIRQVDLKRIIAYSSVAHMNLITLGIFSFNVIGLEGAVIQSISHGFVSSALFILIGILYEKYHSRSLYYYGGLCHMTPIFSIVLLLFTLANIALPGTSSFIGEFMVLCGIYQSSMLCCLFATLGVIFSGAYSLWLYNRIVFGNLKTFNTILYSDLNLKEFVILMPLAFFVFFIGVYPNFIVNYIHLSVSLLFSCFI